MNQNAQASVDVERMREASEWVQRLADPAESGAVFIEWQQWCEAHPANARLFGQMQEVWEGFAPARIAQVASAPARASRRRRGAPFAAAATVLLAIGAAAWLRAGSSGTQELSTETGEVRHELLADGSRLDLGADSEVAVEFSGQQRDLRLIRGRAYFSVAKDAARPFVVRAGDLSVTAVGTAFDIRTGEDNTIVTVSEGRVRITSAQSGEPMHVDAGQRVRYERPAHTLTVAQVDPQLTGSWRQGVLQFQEEPLQDVVGEVNRYSPRRIVLQDSGLGQALFTGTISRERVEDWFVALEKILPVTVEDRGAEGLRIVRRPAAAE